MRTIFDKTEVKILYNDLVTTAFELTTSAAV